MSSHRYMDKEFLNGLAFKKKIQEVHFIYTVVKKKANDKPIIAAAKSLQSCPTLCDPIDGSPPGSPVLGFSRQERWSGCHFLL